MLSVTVKLSDWLDIAVAGGTLLLAITTGVLAWMTRNMSRKTAEMATQTKAEVTAVERQAEATALQAKASQELLEISLLPWITMGHRAARVTENHEGFAVVVLIKNVGAGLALLKPEGCRIMQPVWNEGEGVHTRIGWTAASVLAPGEQTQVKFKVPRRAGPTLAVFSRQDKQVDGDFFVEFEYTDARGGQGTVARGHVSRIRGTWIIATMAYHRPGEQEPFASVRFAIDE